MPPFLRWLAGALVSFGALAGGYHTYLQADPFRVAVIVDSSYSMQAVWPRVTSALREINDRRYTEFSLHSEKSQVHDWRPTLRPDDLVAYAPRNLTKLRGMLDSPDFEDVTEIIFVTNADPTDLDAFEGWTILNLR